MRTLLFALLVLSSGFTQGACDANGLTSAYEEYAAALTGMARHDDPKLRGLLAEASKADFDRGVELREKQIAGGQPQQIQWVESDDRTKMMAVLMKAMRKSPPANLPGALSVNGNVGTIVFEWSKESNTSLSGKSTSAGSKKSEKVVSKATFQCEGHWLLVREEQERTYPARSESGEWKESWAFPQK